MLLSLLTTSGSGSGCFFFVRFSLVPVVLLPSFSSLVPLACNEKGCPTLKSLYFLRRVFLAMPHRYIAQPATLHTPTLPSRLNSFQLGYRTRCVLRLSSIRWCGHEEQACCHNSNTSVLSGPLLDGCSCPTSCASLLMDYPFVRCNEPCFQRYAEGNSSC